MGGAVVVRNKIVGLGEREKLDKGSLYIKMAAIILVAEGEMEDSQGSNGTGNCGSNAIGSSSVDCIGIASGVPTGFLLPSHNLSHAHAITTH
jgi:hypothetical protein